MIACHTVMCYQVQTHTVRVSAKVILATAAIMAAMAFVWVPWTAPSMDTLQARIADMRWPSSETFMGYGWFWQGPDSKSAFDFVMATRLHWGVPNELTSRDIEQLRSLLPSLENDPKSNHDSVIATEQLLGALYPAPSEGVVRPLNVPAWVVKSVDEQDQEKVFLAIADWSQVTSWLKVKKNFDRTFPDKRNLTQEQQLKVLDQWQTQWNRQPLRPYAHIKYSYIVLEILSLTLLAGAALVLLRSSPISERTPKHEASTNLHAHEPNAPVEVGGSNGLSDAELEHYEAIFADSPQAAEAEHRPSEPGERPGRTRDTNVAFANFVIRPYSIVVAITGILLLFRADWALAAAFLVAWFILSVTGHSLLNGEDGFGDAGPKMMLACWLFLGIVAMRGPWRWYYAIPISWLVSFLVVQVPYTAISFFVRLRPSRKLRSP